MSTPGTKNFSRSVKTTCEKWQLSRRTAEVGGSSELLHNAASMLEFCERTKKTHRRRNKKAGGEIHKYNHCQYHLQLQCHVSWIQWKNSHITSGIKNQNQMCFFQSHRHFKTNLKSWLCLPPHFVPYSCLGHQSINLVLVQVNEACT